MSLVIERWPLQGSELCKAYLNDFDRVARFYATGSPAAVESYRAVAERIRANSSAEPWEALRELSASQSGASAEQIERAVEERGLFVSTGQQAGLFVSPLFVLYKALTAARLAHELERRLDLPVVPLFSVASEDHDWAEVDHTHILDLSNRLQRLQVTADRLGQEGSPSPPVERIRLGDDVEEALAALREATPDSEFKKAVLAPLAEAYQPGRPFAEAFQQALSHLLRRYRFLVVRTADPFVKRRTRKLLWSEWEMRAESERRLLERSRELSEAGFDSQVHVTSGVTNLFLEGRLGRDRIVAGEGRARLRRSEEVLEEDELRRVLESSPGRVSPGALLRPVTEARAFPVVAYVAGPSEIAYLAQSHALFDLHEVPAPVIVPRASFQLVESKVGKVLEKYDVSAEQLVADPAGTIRRQLDEQAPEEMQGSLARLRRATAAALERVEAAAVEFDPGSRSAVGSGKKAVFGAIDQLEEKLQARVREKHSVMEQQLEKAAVNLCPDGRPQERVLNPYPYLIRYGESLLDRLYEAAGTRLA